jgi:hypothetical protein
VRDCSAFGARCLHDNGISAVVVILVFSIAIQYVIIRQCDRVVCFSISELVKHRTQSLDLRNDNELRAFVNSILMWCVV